MRGSNKAFIKEGEFKCECGREFTKSQSLYAHQSHCKIHLGDRYDPDKHKGWNLGDARAWSKGRNINDPIYGDSIRRSVNAMRIAYSPGMLGHHHSEESKSKISATRKRKYQSGELVPATGVGRGKYSYLIFSNKRIMLRSTYEFIYALYLLYNDIEFKYESVRVTSDGRTYISDFLIGNKVIEIKGNYNADTRKAEEAFRSQGYDYEVKFWKDLKPCYEYLKTRIDIDSTLDKIRLGHNNHDYYEYNYADY